MIPTVESDPGVRVAVVIPCYNDGATLVETLASLEDQEPTEIVVVDDGSTDPETLRLLNSLTTAKVVRQANSGPAAARMAGVHATTAPLVFPLDADDLAAPGALAVLADALDDAPEAMVAWGDVESFLPNGERSHSRIKARSLDPWLITYMNQIPIASLVRRQALLDVGGWQLREGYEDWDLWLSIAERGWNGVHVGRVVLQYRVHGGRRWASEVLNHDEYYNRLRERHADLFRNRAANWRRSRAPLRLRLLVPVIDRLPLARRSKSRLFKLLGSPSRIPRGARRRLRKRLDA